MSRKREEQEPDLLDGIPAFGTVQTWCKLSGMSRQRTYEWLGLGHLKAKRVGARTIINVRAGLAYMETLPDVFIHAPPARQSESSEAAGLFNALT